MKIPKKRKGLGSNETLNVIEVWSKNVDKLNGFYKSKHIYEDMTRQLETEHEIRLSVEVLRTRITNLITKYRQEKRKIGSDDDPPPQWEYYAKIDEFFGDYDSKNLEDKPNVGGCYINLKEHDSNNLEEEKPNIEKQFKEFEGNSFNGRASPLRSPSPSPSATSSTAPRRSSRPLRFSSSRSANRKSNRKRYESIFLDIAQKERNTMIRYLNKSLEYDEKFLKTLQEYNVMLSKFLNRIN